MITETLASRGVSQMNCSSSSPLNLGIIRSRINRSGSNIEEIFHRLKPVLGGNDEMAGLFQMFCDMPSGRPDRHPRIIWSDFLTC